MVLNTIDTLVVSIEAIVTLSDNNNETSSRSDVVVRKALISS